ncbi:MAG: hypothetical protein J1F02_03555 [Lachnospiraceae bacterium]|nr:hypothetical protein [Lachnospiraceae bacterium]
MKAKKIKSIDTIAAIKVATGTNFSKSFYIPVKKGDHILDAAFLYSAGSLSQTRLRPNASIIIEPGSGSILEYRNSYINDFMDSAKYPMTLELDYSVPSAKSAKEQGELVKTVNELYGDIRKMAFKETLSDAQKKTLAKYNSCFYKAVPDSLVPFYEALSPEFFQWMKEMITLQ